MLDHFGRRRAVVLQHVLDEVDASPRAVELVAEQHIGRAGRGAEAAMHAGAQNLFRHADVRVGELRGGEVRLHQRPSCMRPGLRMPRGSNPFFTRAVSRASSALRGSNTGVDRAHGLRRDDQRGVAARRLDRSTNDAGAGVRPRFFGIEAQPDQSAAPVEEKFRRRQRGEDRMRDRRRAARRRTKPPHDAGPAFEKRLNGADLGPEGFRLRRHRDASRARPAPRAHRRDRRPTAAGLRGAEPSPRRPWPQPRALRTARDGGRQMRGAGDLERRVERLRQSGIAASSPSPSQHEGARRLRPRHHLEGDLGQRRQRAVGARLQFAMS